MNKEILRLAIPNIISNISVPLLSTVDTALMGRMSAAHIGAVGVGSMIFNFIYWNFGFLRMGTTGITAQAFGRQDDKAIVLTLGRAFSVALILAVIVLVLQKPFAQLGFYLMNVPSDQLQMVWAYFSIRILAAPATLAMYAIMGWFFGVQNAIYPLILTIFINIVNILFSFLFIYKYQMDIEAVAWSTVIAQYAGFLLGMALVFYKYKTLFQQFQLKAIWIVDELKSFLKINQDIFIRTFFLTLAFGIFYSRSALLGPAILAVNVILLQFLNWMSYAVDGFAFAAESLIGKYHGAKDELNLKKAIQLSFKWGMIMAVIISLIYGIFGSFLLSIFTDDVALITAGLVFLPWMIFLPIGGTPCYIWDGIYIGYTASKAMRNTMLFAFVIYLIAIFSLESLFANHGLWAALLLFLISRALIQWYVFRKDLGTTFQS